MNGKRAYLTIDDSPSKDFGHKIGFLSERRIPAIFFCVGEQIDAYEDEVIRAIRKGFIIGNHSWSHPHFSDLTPDQCWDEIRKTDEAIDRVYCQSGLPRPAKFFRFPYFDCGGDVSGAAYDSKNQKSDQEQSFYSRDDRKQAIQAYLRELGYEQPPFRGIHLKWVNDNGLLKGIDVRCTFNQMEYYLNRDDAPRGLNKPETILARIDEDDPKDGKALNDTSTTDIILIHDHDPEESVILFYRIIERYLEKGIHFLNVFDNYSGDGLNR